MFQSIGINDFFSYLIGVIVIILMPGPNSLYVLKIGASYGVKAGYKAAIGVFIGDALLILLSFMGLASIIKTSPLLFMVIKYLGAFYLLYLGCKVIYHTFIKQTTKHETRKLKGEAIFRKSLLLSLTNPKAILFYVSFFIQFIDLNYDHVWLSYSVLALVLEFFSFIYLSTLIFFGAMLSTFFIKKRIMSLIGNRLLGTVFIGFALRLASS